MFCLCACMSVGGLILQHLRLLDLYTEYVDIVSASETDWAIHHFNRLATSCRNPQQAVLLYK